MKKKFIVVLVILLSSFALEVVAKVDKDEPEHFTVEQEKAKVTSEVTSNIEVNKPKLPPFQNETIRQSKFKADGQIIEQSKDKYHTDKTIFGTEDLLIINTTKNLSEGTLVSIYKKGKLLAERGSLEEAGRKIEEEEKLVKKQESVVNKIGEARVVEVERKSSVIEILRCIEPVTIGDSVKIISIE